ncbi:hypothetical protein PMI14_02375 [Acidovorax sp. CF316]|uniref:SMI1/KNR4 family protein n=1 Tax=Acidovorax sp. CF316 TaxID=1144317 RepID=UPI00026BD750|nr:SMI1/KNR4 family protein [Acidovorax sp. CF316]EJE52896.1 hypothetical protein PMI14_02375 [Acidovorax sp. CF316]
MNNQATPFSGFDLSGFWEDSDYARKEYVEPPPTPAAIAAVEAALGYRLPASYIALMQSQNGGIPARCCFPTDQPSSWADSTTVPAGRPASPP